MRRNCIFPIPCWRITSSAPCRLGKWKVGPRGRSACSSGPEQEADEAAARYLKSLSKGLLKVLSKMGISTLRSYQGAQLFEAIGIHEDLVQEHFPGTPSQIGGIGLEEIALEVLARHDLAFAQEAKPDLEDGGFHRYRKGGEAHAFAPDVVKALHALTKRGEPLKYENFA